MADNEAHDSGVNNGDSSAPVPQLSKNQQKKQKRQEAARQKMLFKKAEEKAARKASQEKKLAEREQRMAQMTEEEKEAWNQRSQEKREVCAHSFVLRSCNCITSAASPVVLCMLSRPCRVREGIDSMAAASCACTDPLTDAQARKQTDKERKEKLQRAQESGQRIIIDLSFADKMTGAEVRSMCQQLSYSYSANARVTKPAHLILTGYEVS